jgi:hypothetical protein
MLLVKELQQAGVSVWTDREQIEGATHYAEEIVRGIRGCRVLLLACSDASMRSWAVKQEIQIAGEQQKVLLPVILSPTNFPDQIEFFLAGRQRIEVGERPAREWLPRLLRALESAGVSHDGESTSGSPAPAESVNLAWSLEELWQLGSFTDQLWPVPATGLHPVRPTRGFRDLGEAQEEMSHVYRLGDQVRLMLESNRPGELLLIDRGTSGKLYSLCPSAFAPSTRVERGLNAFPQAGARYQAFKLSGSSGREKLLAILSDDPLPLDWTSRDPGAPARLLTESDVRALLACLRQLPPRSWVAMSTYFDVRS